MIKETSRDGNGFTLVELLAVIVILAIILVIAVPKVMSIIEDAKKGTLESTAKMIASGAEKQKVQNTVLGNTEEITCDSVAKINSGDYANCSIKFEDNTAKVTIEGKGKFDGFWVCDGTKTSAKAIRDGCNAIIETLKVKQNRIILTQEEFTLSDFDVIAKYSDGSENVLHKGGLKIIGDGKVITSPNWPENYAPDINEELYWEQKFEGADAIQVIFDENSFLGWGEAEYIWIYNENNEVVYQLYNNAIRGKSYIINGNYVKLVMSTDLYNSERKFKATLKPMYDRPAEYTISPLVAPEDGGEFEIIASLDLDVIHNNGNAVIEKTSAYVSMPPKYGLLTQFIEDSYVYEQRLNNGLIVDDTVDENIRYVGSDPNNKIYFNCTDIDLNNVIYGEENYDYSNSCEVWRIIGLIETNRNENASSIKKVKIVRNNLLESRVFNSNNSQGWIGSNLEIYLNGNNENDYYSNLSENSKEMIENTPWNIGDTQWLEGIGPDFFYGYETEIQSSSRSVGLISVSDYGYASTNCKYGVNDFRCSQNNWLSENNYYWTLIPNSDDVTSMWVVGDYATSSSASNSSKVRPSVYLKDDVRVIGGNGNTEPYILK